jgi:hypothetical protein
VIWARGTTTIEPIPSIDGTPRTRRSLALLTDSRAKTFRRCPREHLYRYEEGYLPVADKPALRFGDVGHVGLAAWWTEPVPADRLAASLDAIVQRADDDFDPYDLAKLEEMLRGYDARWGEEPWQTLAVESEFRTPLINPHSSAASKTFLRAGKLDVIARDPRGRIVFVEHKTSSEDITSGSNYWSRLRLDGQVSGYFRGADSLGYHAEACIYDVLGKPALRPLKATPFADRKFTKAGQLYAAQRDTDETPAEYGARIREAIAAAPEKYYARGEVVRLEEEMRQHDLEAWALAQSIRDARRLEIAPKNPDACVRFGARCPFFAVCCGEASLDDEALFRRSEWVHPELTKEESGT